MFTLLILQVTMTGRAWTSFISNLLPSENLALTIALLTNDMFWNFQGTFRHPLARLCDDLIGCVAFFQATSCLLI